MKWFILPLTLLVLLLSALPCCAETASVESVVQEHASRSDEADGSCEENCSPFYSCGTCTTSFGASGWTLSSPHPICFITLLTPYTLPVVQEPARNIWQPPKWL